MDDNSDNNYESDFHSSTKSYKKDADFKTHLLKVLQEKGIVDKLKSQVRQNLISEISQKNTSNKIDDTPKYNQDNDIIHHSCISMLSGFLMDHDLSYSLSVFLPEVGVSKDKLYSTEEILRILQIDYESAFYKKLLKAMQSNSKSFFWNFLTTISNYHSSKRREIDIQTEKRDKYIPISEKMEKVDFDFEGRQKQGMLRSQQLFEERMASYQRDLDKRYKIELENEITKIRTQEISILKLKEEENFSRLLKEKVKKLEDEYQHRIAALKDREQTSQTNVLKQKECQDRENYLQRQQLLRDVNNIQQRELEMKKDRDRIERELELMRDQHRLKMETLEAKESKLREMEMSIEIKIQEQVNDNKLSEEKKLIHKWKEVEILEEKLNEERKAVGKEREKLDTLKQELSFKQSLFSELEIIGYPVMKQKCQMLEARIEELEKEKQQQIEVNNADKARMESLMKQLTVPNHETAAISHELERTRDKFQQFKKDLEIEKESLEKRLVQEVRQRKIMTEQYTEQQDTIEDLTRKLSEASEFRARNKHGGGSVGIPLTNRSTARNQGGAHKEHLMDSGDNSGGNWDDRCTGEITQRLMCLDEETEQINKAYQEFRHRLSNPVSNLGCSFDDSSRESPIIKSVPYKQGVEEGRQMNINWDLNNHFEANYTYPSYPENYSIPQLPVQSSDSAKPNQSNSATFNLRPIGFEVSDNQIAKSNTATFNLKPIGFQSLDKQVDKPKAPIQPSGFQDSYSGFPILNNQSMATLNGNQEDNFQHVPNERNTMHQPNSFLTNQPTAPTAPPLEPIQLSDPKTQQPYLSSKQFDEESSSESSKIQLDQNWKNQQEKHDSTTISNQQSNNNPTDLNPKPKEIRKDEKDEDEEIDPVIKQYMELIKKKKAEPESNTVAPKASSSNIPQKEESDVEEITEEFSAHSGGSVSSKKGLNKNGSDEDDSFW